MEGFKGTPGEWRWFTSNSHKRLSSVLSGKDGDVLYAYNDSTGLPMVGCTENDMALIAAAPELLEALQKIKDVMDSFRYLADRVGMNDADGFYLGHTQGLSEKAEAAIKKALGQ